MKRWRGKTNFNYEEKKPPPPSTNGCHYMTFVLETKIVKKDLPRCGLDSLGLPKMGKSIFMKLHSFYWQGCLRFLEFVCPNENLAFLGLLFYNHCSLRR